MPQIITNTAILSCNQGTATSKLNVTSQDFVTIEGKAMATEEDKQANANILPFKQRYFDDSLTTTSYYSPNKAVVTTSRIEPFVIAHEVYHSLGLPHSFENKNHIPQTLQGGNREIQSNGEYSFEYRMTTNIMDYSDHRNNLFYWQIKIVRSKAAPEPNNYRPEQL